MRKIRRNDEVIVIAGRDKGRRGKVLKIAKDGRLFVAGINMVKKHQKPNPMLGRPGGVVAQEAAIQASNVAIWNPERQKRDRVGFSFTEEGRKQRVFKSNGNPVDV